MITSEAISAPLVPYHRHVIQDTPQATTSPGLPRCCWVPDLDNRIGRDLRNGSVEFGKPGAAVVTSGSMSSPRTMAYHMRS